MTENGLDRLNRREREAILEFIHKNKTRAKDVVKRLQLMGIEISPEQEQKLGKLEKEVIKVK